MITHHKCFSTYPVICDGSDSPFTFVEERVEISFSLVSSETSSWLPQKKQILVSSYPTFTHAAPQPLFKFLRCTNTILCRLVPQLWPWGLVFFQSAALMSSILRTHYAHVSLMQPRCSWLSSLPRSSSLKPSFIKVSLWGVNNCSRASASISLSQTVVQTIMLWIWGWSESQLRQSLYTQVMTFSRHDRYSWYVTSFYDPPTFSPS